MYKKTHKNYLRIKNPLHKQSENAVSQSQIENPLKCVKRVRTRGIYRCFLSESIVCFNTTPMFPFIQKLPPSISKINKDCRNCSFTVKTGYLLGTKPFLLLWQKLKRKKISICKCEFFWCEKLFAIWIGQIQSKTIYGLVT